ncbi:hypothetical protein [Paraburkholderia solisilvae]|uniref:Uncharacterized protein n=1 Tax=Paraburkholderia solisilvae TaxID=624376 RepID=A0A6J5ED32_9BURK|nr:hypothetical protein [Paraburkholderia solisilvae]CAB3764389.1 hypothetical protein LMG29739_04344 [Paraburkholderia solisilvae]
MTLERPPISGDFQNAAEHNPSRQTGSTKPAPPFSLRLSTDERAELLRRAGSMPLGAYIRSRLLSGTESPRRTRRQPVKDEQALEAPWRTGEG